MANKYTKPDMIYTDYDNTTTPGDDPKLRGTPDSSLFNRKELYEVLYLINSLNLSTLEECQKAEMLIHDELPGDTRSQEDVKEWLEENL